MVDRRIASRRAPRVRRGARSLLLILLHAVLPLAPLPLRAFAFSRPGCVVVSLRLHLVVAVAPRLDGDFFAQPSPNRAPLGLLRLVHSLLASVLFVSVSGRPPFFRSFGALPRCFLLSAVCVSGQLVGGSPSLFCSSFFLVAALCIFLRRELVGRLWPYFVSSHIAPSRAAAGLLPFFRVLVQPPPGRHCISASSFPLPPVWQAPVLLRRWFSPSGVGRSSFLLGTVVLALVIVAALIFVWPEGVHAGVAWASASPAEDAALKEASVLDGFWVSARACDYSSRRRAFALRVPEVRQEGAARCSSSTAAAKVFVADLPEQVFELFLLRSFPAPLTRSPSSFISLSLFLEVSASSGQCRVNCRTHLYHRKAFTNSALAHPVGDSFSARALPLHAASSAYPFPLRSISVMTPSSTSLSFVWAFTLTTVV